MPDSKGVCRELDLGPAVQWLGDASMYSLAGEYKRCDVFCLPSVQEGFGIVFLEAMAAGKPVVAARAGAIPELVRNGVLVEPENPGALAEAIICLYSRAGFKWRLFRWGGIDSSAIFADD